MVVGATPRDPTAERQKYRGNTSEVISVCGDRPHNPRLWRARQRGMQPTTITVTGPTPQQNVERNRIRETFSIKEARTAMCIDWMGMKDLSQAIPPAYTKWIGHELMQALEQRERNTV